MPIKEESSNSFLQHQLFHGTTWHSRLLPNIHKFVYPYRYWGVNISALAAGQTLPEVSVATSSKHKILGKLPLFSAKRKALQQFCPDDYLQDFNSLSKNNDVNNLNNKEDGLNSFQALNHRLHQVFTDHTGSAPTGDMLGLLVCRNAGLYFSPVNFYIGFDNQQTPTHLLAEVSNTPWNKRHYYGFLLNGTDTELCHDKNFHVSPFNPIDQLYRWQVTIKNTTKNEMESQLDNGLQVRIAIDISDERGDVLKTGIKMAGVPMTDTSVRDSLQKNPLMNLTSVTRIYWHAFKLYAIKKVPYINYDEKLADSQQQTKALKKTGFDD
ncbi:DUF1365 domain-containing protein [Psychrobacter aquaticus]|uniref:DUF1365 domain-containing protein n=1 Tax=Psychrobacter aquaticus CMS 56 TaxID=1354303 RepID=U4T4G1_9GAMM|nr:DUF1365 domain-containing protein [Psychrobacter aquaticus]ERL55800.1 hypothetical protein M917_1322 [Psychrobacter aquaticus CMS 56]